MSLGTPRAHTEKRAKRKSVELVEAGRGLRPPRMGELARPDRREGGRARVNGPARVGVERAT